VKRFLLATAGGLLVTGSALAADLYEPVLPIPAPPAAVAPPPALVPNWTGFYFGVNGGLGANRFELPFVSGAATGTPSLNMDRGIGGVQVGYSWQIRSNWIIGLETDFEVSDVQRVGEYVNIAGGGPLLTAGSNLQWFGTLRPRLGYAVTPAAFLYLTGGWAYGHSISSVTSVTGVSSFSHDISGWALGGFGLEYALTSQLSFKTEYIYLTSGATTIASGPAFSIDEKMIAHTLKAGLNLKLPPL